ncbi:MAG TPA: DUF2071 domain-containing protein [Pyrinomonadaceae bacterium]|nr:DUF2071 domain-containing protein [Pyrinomonadaceae bacterium]
MERDPSTDTDILTARAKPDGFPVMHQNWGKLLFMHWPIAPELLRPLIPERLTIDTYKSMAWIGVIPFTMWGIRPILLPAIPGLSAMHELNVRTYVHLDHHPGVWFLSLDINSVIAKTAARNFYFLPYYNAQIDLEQKAATIHYTLERDDADSPGAKFDAKWKIGEELSYSKPGSIEFFLTERYCLYTEHRNHLYRASIYHEPWPLQKAELVSMKSTMIESHGLPTPAEEPLLHYAEALAVDIWPIEEL